MIEKSEDCPICFEALGEVENKLEECGHWMHIECFKKCYRSTCPICRVKITSIKIDDKVDTMYDHSEFDNQLEQFRVNVVYENDSEESLLEDSEDEMTPHNLYIENILFEIRSCGATHEYIQQDIEWVEHMSEQRHLSPQEIESCEDALLRARLNKTNITDNDRAMYHGEERSDSDSENDQEYYESDTYGYDSY